MSAIKHNENHRKQINKYDEKCKQQIFYETVELIVIQVCILEHDFPPKPNFIFTNICNS